MLIVGVTCVVFMLPELDCGCLCKQIDSCGLHIGTRREHPLHCRRAASALHTAYLQDNGWCADICTASVGKLGEELGGRDDKTRRNTRLAGRELPPRWAASHSYSNMSVPADCSAASACGADARPELALHLWMLVTLAPSQGRKVRAPLGTSKRWLPGTAAFLQRSAETRAARCLG